jgi:hypothetical protein
MEWPGQRLRGEVRCRVSGSELGTEKGAGKGIRVGYIEATLQGGPAWGFQWTIMKLARTKLEILPSTAFGQIKLVPLLPTAVRG